jgi:hypothetical protein
MVDQLSSIVPGLSASSQAEWLQNWGIGELVSEGIRYWEEHKSDPDVAALKMRSRANEVQVLTSLDGLGAFSALELNL